MRSNTGADDVEFVDFVRESQFRLCRFAFLVCGDWHRAEDIVQIALARVYARWTSIKREGGLDSYVRKAVVNATIDEGRRPWRREHSTDVLPDAVAPAADELAQRLVDSLAHLPAGQRAVVVLRYIEDVDVETTAGLLGISTGTVKSQAAKGLASMRVLLAGGTVTAGLDHHR